ncbi:hypothetical protein G3A_06095 [Bacillus sp. 17376]|uniref:Uncharacterized protein n=1 Tax=Mesobacillus boroniphilus JCM 21738 TaxID=1294265 RepID=W4RM05_9BACI|nr:hypothetical protein [Mesobacillus boroniphilus]ESU33487.1 hypothetical protein G3A_06095 [Bacillus sp. 17376]GAE45366.1 hypothetical protein JCM21738_2161 [Mesobacillus boroniphilus JCM 21738]
MEKQNSVAKVLRVIGIIIMIGGFFLALTTGSSQNLGMALPVLFSSFVTGMLFIGFSEVIALLQKIHFQLYQDGSKATASSSNEPEVDQPQEQKEWQPSPQDLEDIQELYQDQKVTKIEASPYEDYCVVQIEGKDHIEVVELGGFKPKKVTAASKPDLVNNIQKWFKNLTPS